MTSAANRKITLDQLNKVNSAITLLEIIYGNVQNIELPIDVDFITNSIDKVKLSQELDFNHLDKAGLIKVSRNDNNDVNAIKIWVNPLEPEVRQRFTQAHEIGHLIYDIFPELDNPKLDDEFIDVLHRKEGVKSFRETRANRFSAQLLMPSALVNSEINKLILKVKSTNKKMTKEEVITHLSSVFLTSNDAMKYRLKDLNVI